MDLFDELKELGVNTEEGLDQLMGNDALYKKLLGKFVNLMERMEIDPNFDNTNFADIIDKAHAVKGTSGNLFITPVYESYAEIVSLLRNNQPEEAKEVLLKIIPVQNKIIDCIKKYVPEA